jgi:hypothetical protein
MGKRGRGHLFSRAVIRPGVPAPRHTEKVGEIGLEPTNLTDVNRAL